MDTAHPAKGEVIDGEQAVALLPLVGLAALGAVAMNGILPSLGALQAAFAASEREMQLTLTLFLVGAAAAQLGFGAASDACGRRPVLLAAVAIFCVGSAVAASAPSIGILALGRLFQGLGGAACLILAEAIVADASGREALARRVGYLNAGMAAAILAAPLLGAILQRSFGWRSVLVAILLAGAAVGAVSLREAARRPALAKGAGGWLAGTCGLARSAAFLRPAVSAACVMASYFCLVAFGPSLLMAHFGLGSLGFALLFAWLGAAYVAGTLLSPVLYRRFGRYTTILRSLVVATLAACVAVIAGRIADPGLAGFTALASVMAANAGIVLPGLTASALAADRGAAGAAAGLLNFAIFAGGATVTHLAGSLAAMTPASVALIMLGANAAALLASLDASAPRG